jgi:cellulose synthase/poly-beta-1,6-N-acetylglucosamine synthase-like glycosyltransferase
MSLYEIGFWVCVFLILYPYFLYPIGLAILGWLLPRSVIRDGGPRSVSIIIPAHNEQQNIDRRLKEFLALLERTDIEGEIIAVSDGSTDNTAGVIQGYTNKNVRLLELPQRIGKAEALNRAVALAKNEIVVFADTRQTWEPDALQKLLENFADCKVGAVSGDLVVSAVPGTMSGVGLYWKYEKWVRCAESRIGSQVGVTGAISACRRVLYTPIPPGTLLDDVYWPLLVAMKGYRIVHDTRAVAYDKLPENNRDEFRRKVRTLSGNFQLIARLPQALVPWRNPIWFRLISHKLARLFVPWALVGVLLFAVGCKGWIYDLALFAQGIIYTICLVGLCTRRGGWMGSAGSFLLLNAAAWVAFWVWVTGRAENSWGKVAYADSNYAGGPPGPPVAADTVVEKKQGTDDVRRITPNSSNYVGSSQR